MRFDKINKLVRGVPYISQQNAKYLYDLIVKEKLTRILELGVAYGTATCFMAAAVEEIGGGRVTSVDLTSTKDFFSPSPEEQLTDSGLKKFVDIIRVKSGYSWFLHDEIKKSTKYDMCIPEYDLCIIDGPKNWTIDGGAFFMVDKLLKPGGWIIFDDYSWSYSEVDNLRDSTDGVTHRSLSEVEIKTPQIQEVFELLVKQHPNYSNFEVFYDGTWAIAQKVN